MCDKFKSYSMLQEIDIKENRKKNGVKYKNE